MLNKILVAFLVTVFMSNQSIAQVLIKNVKVIDVEKKKILDGYDVVVLDGKIVSVEKGRMYKLPEGTEVIDGTGKYLIPGLVDGHVHFFQSGGMFTRPDVIDLRKWHSHEREIKWVHDNVADLGARYLSAGITTVVDVGASFNFLAQRDSLIGNKYLPTISMTGPLLTTYVPEVYSKMGGESPFIKLTDEEQTRETVREVAKHKADFIKIWYIVLDQDIEKGARKNLPMIQAAIDEAHKLKLRVAVHATELPTARLAVEAGADFLVHNVFSNPIDDSFIKLLKAKKTVVCPTVVVGGNYAKALTRSYQFSTAELNLANPTTIASILDFPWPDTALASRYIRMASNLNARQAKEDSITMDNLKKLVNGGVIIASGTDAGNIGTQHASSLMIELMDMRKAGMDNWQLLQASTINGAKMIGRENEFGSIAKGKTGDLVLLNKNPLDALENWSDIDVVINKGNVIKPDSILPNSPLSLVQRQLNAYNAHNLDAFLAPYADDVEIFMLGDTKPSMKGIEEMRKAYQFVNTTPNLYCRLLNRTIQGNVIVDHEEVWGFGKDPVYAIAIYMIEKGKISKVYFPR